MLVHSQEWFDDCFTQYDTKAQKSVPAKVPKDIRQCAEAFCRVFNIKGVCDPMYLANCIAVKLGRGDGSGEFYAGYSDSELFPHQAQEVESFVDFAYSTCIHEAKVTAAKQKMRLPSVQEVLQTNLQVRLSCLDGSGELSALTHNLIEALSEMPELPAFLQDWRDAAGTVLQSHSTALTSRWVDVRKVLPPACRDVRVRLLDGSTTMGRVRNNGDWEYVRFKSDVDRGRQVPSPHLPAVAWLDDGVCDLLRPEHSLRAAAQALYRVLTAFVTRAQNLPEDIVTSEVQALAEDVQACLEHINQAEMGPCWLPVTKPPLPYAPVLLEVEESRRIARINEVGTWELGSYQFTKWQYVASSPLRWYRDES